ncbi:TrmH family RNA methyltransferase [Planctomycetes bacterium K23_9]|uniref:TrmH family tRNA/rRNA methyltransferase n=1 Tax=Stieleria marina TaxID=1930275 RepID=A0A517NVA8_9BACT|nr:Putative TrmH family tRNA/rRNA methyltransferase [Planctomycetes bacterium K23_9]
MRPIQIVDPRDPRVASYVDLRRSRAGSGQAAVQAGTFIAEGRLVVERLIASDYELQSVLVQQGREEAFLDQLNSDTPVYTMASELISQVVGFDFHRGVIACGKRRDISAFGEQHNVSLLGRLSLCLLGMSEQENLGSILRSAAALGVHNVFLGPGTIDPLSRRVIRVSMATALKHRYFRMTDPGTELTVLQQRGVRTIASTLADPSQMITDFQRDDRPMILIIGNEAKGIEPIVQAAVSDRVKIPMSNQVDSLNASVAAAILMYELAK